MRRKLISFPLLLPGPARAEAEEAVRVSGRQPAQPGVQHGADQLRHAEPQGHQDHRQRNEGRSQGDEEGVQDHQHRQD